MKSYTRKYGDDKDFSMPCWFCQQICHMSIDELDSAAISNFYCQNKVCQDHRVNHIFAERFGTEVYAVLSKVTLSINLNSRLYEARYLVNSKELELLEKVNLPISDSDSLDFYLTPVFCMPYESLPLTPQNIKHKLPTLLLFL